MEFCGKKILFRHSEIPRHRRGISGDFREKSTKAYLLLISSVKKTANAKKLGETELFCVLYKRLIFNVFLHATHIGEHFRRVAQDINL